MQQSTKIFVLLWCCAIEYSFGNLPPVITNDLNTLLVKEDLSVGTQVLVVKAEDPEGSRIRYGLQGSGALQIDVNTGAVTTTQPLDREVKDSIRVLITVEDEVEGADNNLVRIPLEIVVLDVNDNEPIFSHESYRTSILEDASVGTTVAHISLSDIDQVGDVITVSCVDNDVPTRDFYLVPKQMSSRSYQGSLVLKLPLSYLSRNEFKLTLVASDGRNIVTTPMIITVKDVQNSPPVFFGSTTGVLPENAPIGSLVMTLRAEDQDKGNQRSVLYELVENPMGFFLLDSENGELRAAKPLDRESIPDQSGVIQLKVKAYEIEGGSRVGGNFSEAYATIYVTIQDVNDEAPSFTKKEYRVSIPEDLPLDTPVPDLGMDVSDTDAGSNSVFDLRLVDPSGWFSLSPHNATGSTTVSLKLSRLGLDYENPNKRKFILLVVAEETLTAERLSSTATVVVSVTDTNDNRPAFLQEAYTAMVSETAAGGALVTTIAATDPDTGKFGTDGIVYSLQGNGAHKFGVDKMSGVITVSHCENPGKGECLDYENRPTYFLSLQAADDNGRGLKAVVPLRISLRDDNDNPPKFAKSAYRAVIQEGAVHFEPPLVVKANDPDVSSRLQYTLLSGSSGDLFRINSQSGKIQVTDPNGLNISHMRITEFILTIEVSDGLGSHSCKVHVSVHDVNNNKPIFLESIYKASVQENAVHGTIVDIVTAADLDTGANAEISYRIAKGAYLHFDIDETTGEVYVSKKLNFERRKFYEVGIVASDKGVPQLSSQTLLQITVIDNNDKNPYFVPTTQRVQVKEDVAVGSIIHILKTEDRDVSPEIGLYVSLIDVWSAVDDKGVALKTNQLAQLQGTFKIEPTGELKLIEPLNRNMTAEITLRCSVTDVSANPQQTAEGFLVITVVDVNDNSPTFPDPWTPNYPFLTVTVAEELPVGSVVTTMVASDVDSSISSYEIVPPSELLRIDRVTGVVTVKGRLDYETIESVNVTVVVKDTGVPQLSASANLIVKLENINDEEPTFEKEFYEVEVLEHSPPGTLVEHVVAHDKDNDLLGRLTFSLAGDDKQYFRIDSTGKITIGDGQELDRESISLMRLRAVATDIGPKNTRKETSVPIRITILDINDHEPHFDQKIFSSTVFENLPLYPPVPVLQVKATDEDEGINSALSFKIIGGSGKDLFWMNSNTGILYPSSKLTTGENESTFDLTVEVRDMNGTGPTYDVAKLLITILPRNEHKPIFRVPPHQTYTVSIPEESSKSDMLVLTVKAKDGDTGRNGDITYHFRVNDQNVQQTDTFKISPKSGEIRTIVKLDRELAHEYELVLVAKDLGSPISFETLRILMIDVTDKDDHKPSFPQNHLQNSYFFSIKENIPKGALIGRVKAFDEDESENARIFYYLISGNDDDSFSLDKSNGNLFSKRSLDREQHSHFELKVKATNDPNLNVNSLGNSSTLSDTSITRVFIEVEDENDNPPDFKRETFYAGVSFNAEVGHLLQKLKADDPDRGKNSTLVYSILSSTLFRPGESKPVGSIVPSPFNMTGDGSLLTAARLFPYRKHQFLLEIQAKEEATPHRVDNCMIYIWVWELEDLLKVVVEQPPEAVLPNQEEIADKLSLILHGQAVVDEIRYFTYPNNSISREWTEMLMHVVNKTSHVIPAVEILKTIDKGFSQLEKSGVTSKIRSIYPVTLSEPSTKFDARYAGLIALLVALFIGLFSFIIVCCCLRFWVMSSTKSKELLIQRVVNDDQGLNTTENPLWIDQKLKRYEEQELSMQVMSEFDPSAVGSQHMLIKDPSPNVANADVQSNTYATIQKSHGGTVRSLQLRNMQHRFRSLDFSDDMLQNSDYATLDYMKRANGNANISRGPTIPGVETPYSGVISHENRNFDAKEELVTRFTDEASHLKEPTNMLNRPLPEEPGFSSGHYNERSAGSRRSRDQMILNEPCFVAELI